MRKKSRPHPSLNLCCKLYLKHHGGGILMMGSFLLGKGLTAKVTCARSWQSSQVALLASLGEPNCTRGKVGEMRKDGYCGRATKQETSKLSNPDSQSGRICSKWHWFRKGDKSKITFHSNYHTCKAYYFWKRFVCSPSLEFSPCFEMQKDMFSHRPEIFCMVQNSGNPVIPHLGDGCLSDL